MENDASLNLTMSKQIVRPLDVIGPQSGHDLVVFRRVGPNSGGRRFHSLFGPEDNLLGLRLLRMVAPQGFAAYAVTRDEELRHVFTREVTTWDRVGSFTLRFTLTLQVDDPQEIAEHLDQDPLRRLEEKAEDLFVHAASREDWVAISKQGVAYERSVLTSRSIDAQEASTANLDLLRGFAQRRGFSLRDVRIEVKFSENFGRWIREEIEREAEAGAERAGA
jgi:hypothetical protein